MIVEWVARKSAKVYYLGMENGTDEQRAERIAQELSELAAPTTYQSYSKKKVSDAVRDAIVEILENRGFSVELLGDEHNIAFAVRDRNFPGEAEQNGW